MRPLDSRTLIGILAVLAPLATLAPIPEARAAETLLLPPELGQYLPEGTIAVLVTPSFSEMAADVRSVVSLFDEETASGIDLEALVESQVPGLWSVVDDEAPAVVAFALGAEGPGAPNISILTRLAADAPSQEEIAATVGMPVVEVHDEWVVMSVSETYAPSATALDILEGLPAADVVARIDLEKLVATFGPMLRAMMSMGMASAAADSTSEFQLAPESQRSIVDILDEVLNSARSLDLALDYDGRSMEVLVSFGTLEGSVLAPVAQPDFDEALTLSRLLPPQHETHVVSALDFSNVLDLYREGASILRDLGGEAGEDEIFELYGLYLEQLLDSATVLFAPQVASFGFDSGSPELAWVVQSEEVDNVTAVWTDLLDSVAAETELVSVQRTPLELRSGWTTERVDVDLDLDQLADPEDPDAAVVMGILEALVPNIYVGHRDGMGAVFATSNSEHFLALLDRIDDPESLEIPAALKEAHEWAGSDVQQISTIEFRGLLDSAFDLVRAFVDIPLEAEPPARLDTAMLVDAKSYTTRMRVDLESAGQLILELFEVFEAMESPTEDAESEVEEARLDSPPGEGQPLDSERAAEMGARLRSEVERLRGHVFQREVPVAVVDDAAARQHFLKRLADELPAEMMDVHARVYVDLGLLESAESLESTLLSLLEEQAGGYYDPGEKELFLLDDMPPETAPVIMVHELTHALDDQLYDLDEKIQLAQESNDRMNAFGCVTEGSGMAVMTAWMTQAIMSGELSADAITVLSESEAGQAERLASAPALLGNSLLVPYLAGPRFLLRGNMLAMATGADVADIDRAFQDPPVSMEQVLHPQKYWNEDQRDLPREVSLPDLSAQIGPDWRERSQGTLGELDLATLTGLRIDAQDAGAMMAGRYSTPAAEGWDGDRFSLLEEGDRSVTILAVVFDSAADATEFADAVDLPEGSQLRRQGEVLVLVCGDAPERAASVAEAALGAVEVREP